MIRESFILRTTGTTKMNTHSSRSHLIVTFHLVRSDGEKHAKLTLVDLAGSECLKQTEATGLSMKEAKNINLSLFELTNVLRDLNIPNKAPVYRNSKLTMMLKVSLFAHFYGIGLFGRTVKEFGSHSLESYHS